MKPEIEFAANRSHFSERIYGARAHGPGVSHYQDRPFAGSAICLNLLPQRGDVNLHPIVCGDPTDCIRAHARNIRGFLYPGVRFL